MVLHATVKSNKLCIAMLMMLFAVFGGQARADLVTNIDEPNTVNFGTSGLFEQASSFTTGNIPFQLSSITMLVHVNPVGPQGVARLYAGTLGSPGTLLEELSIVEPNVVGSQAAVFQASGATILAANSQYWVSISSPNNGDFQWQGTTSTNYFSSEGWTIGDQMKIRFLPSLTWEDVDFGPSNETGLFSVQGVQAVPEPSTCVACIMVAAPVLLRHSWRRRRLKSQ